MKEYIKPEIREATQQEINHLIGDKIRSLRERIGLRQDSLAQRCGISKSFLSKIESGQANPSMSTLNALALQLHVTRGDLV